MLPRLPKVGAGGEPSPPPPGMCALRAVLGLLLFGALRAFPQVRGCQEPGGAPAVESPLLLTAALSPGQSGTHGTQRTTGTLLISFPAQLA